MRWLLALLVVGVLFHLHRKRMAKFSAGMNAVLAAATYRTLTKPDQARVDTEVAAVCEQIGYDVKKLGPSYPGGDRDTWCPPALLYAFRASAMSRVGIAPIDPKYPYWMPMANPFLAMLAGGQMASSRDIVERNLGVKLTELDS